MSEERPTAGDGRRPGRGEAVPDGGERQCVNCGAPLGRYSKFCSECGTEQSPDADTEQSGGERQQGEVDSGQPTGDRWTGGDGQPGTGGQSGARGQPGGGQPGTGGQSGARGQPGGGQPGTGGQGGARGQPGGGQPGTGGQGGARGQPGGGQPGTGRQGGARGQQRGPRGQQQRGGQQYGRQPDRLQTAGPRSSTGMAGLAHILALITGLFGPIILYAVTDDPFVKENAANATNWQIVLIVYNFSAFVLIFVALFISEILALLAVLLFFGLIGANLVFIGIGTIKALNGEAWSYPITPDLL